MKRIFATSADFKKENSLIDHVLIVRADWDSEAEVWVAHSDDVPGLATDADTFEELMEKLKTAAPELLEENGLLSKFDGPMDVPFSVMAQRVGHIRRPV